MRRFPGLLMLTWFLPGIVFSQNIYTLSGRVTDESMSPLPGAAVLLNRGEKGIVTDRNGYFELSGLRNDRYLVEISFLGYENYEDSISPEITDRLDVMLKPQARALEGVVVAGDYAGNRKKEESLDIEIVDDEYLKQNLGGSLMKSLERLPGVSSIGIGSGQSKPVIRGLGFNRIAVIENGIKHQGQQWGADHGLEIDPYAAERVEVVKGPASLMYGSDAIGGIIDIKQTEVPMENTAGGSVDLTGESNNRQLASSAYLYARRKRLFITVRGTLASYADYRVPADSVDIYSYRVPLYGNRLRNTAGKEQNIHFSLGMVQERFSSRLFFSNLTGRDGFFANAHGLEPRSVDTDLHDRSARDIQYPYHRVDHLKIINKNEWISDGYRFESELGFQHNYRQEWSRYVGHGYMPATFPDTLPFPSGLEKQFDKYIYSGSVKGMLDPGGNASFRAGIGAEYQDNRIDGTGFIIPAFTQLGWGSFVYGRYNLSSDGFVHAGARYDHTAIHTRPYSDWFPSPVADVSGDTVGVRLQRASDISRQFNSLSWSAGINYSRGGISVKANIGRSFRVPIAKELAANGVNYHNFSYEIGDSALSPEISYQLDAGLDWNASGLSIGISPFINFFPNYIYLNPSYRYDRLYGNGNQVFYYTQSRVLRFGGEIHADYRVFETLHAGFTGEYLYSRQLSGEKKGFSLPFSPPPSVLLNVKYSPEKAGFFGGPYLSVDFRLTAGQDRIVPPEKKTPGYGLLNVSFGGTVGSKRQAVSLAFQVLNLLDRKYYDHTSYYRLINVPEAGRNFILNVHIPFRKEFNSSY